MNCCNSTRTAAPPSSAPKCCMRWAIEGRGSGRHGRRARYRHLAGAPSYSDPDPERRRVSRAACRRWTGTGLRVRQRRSRRRAVHLQQQADRRRALHGDVRRRDRPAADASFRRRATTTATARTPPRPRPATPASRASIFGVSRGRISGIAPRAHVAMYKVCGDQGCFASDSVAAVQQAILDGVDVINFSISGGSNPYADAVSLAFLDAYNAGVFVAASAGNSGPGAEHRRPPRPWVTTVARQHHATATSSTT